MRNNSSGKLVAIFDLDGTLVNTDEINSEAYRGALAKAGVRVDTAQDERVTMKTITRACKGLSTKKKLEIARLKEDEYVRLLWKSELGPAAEALRMVLRCRDQFAKVVLLTDGKVNRVMETLRFHGLEACFDEIVCNGGNGDKYFNYFRTHHANPAFTVVWENDSDAIRSAVGVGVNSKNIRKVG